MNENIQTKHSGMRFRHFSNRPYAVFRSLNVQVSIGVLAVATLTFANVETVSAQTENKLQEQLYELEEVEVTGSRVPLTVAQAARMVTVLDREAIEAAPVQSINDLLKYAVGVDVRQRGGLGVQTDISIRGGTQDQITILLNGINIGDPQTGHNTADFPIDLSEIERIEVLEGPAGRVYGTSSLLGAINIVTRTGKKTGGEVRAEAGSYGYFNGGGRLNLTKGKVANQASASFTRSDGYSRNRAGRLNADFTNTKAFYQGNFSDAQVDVRWHAGMTQKDFGSNTFYGTSSDDQFEHTRKFYTAVQAETKGPVYHFRPAVYWNRGEDRFEYFRGTEEKVPYNYSRTDVYGLNLNNYIQTRLGKTAFGAEFRNEGIVSTKLGEPLNEARPIHGTDRSYTVGLNRTNMSFHLEHTVVLPRFTLSAGVIAVKNTWDEAGFRFYPGADASYQLARDWKVYASYNTSLRMPTFTELYYTVDGYQADKFLKPEEMSALEAGLKYLTPGVRATLSLFYHHGTNMIDWIKDISQGEDAPWQSVNHTKINTLGAEMSVGVDLRQWFASPLVSRLHLAYSFMDKDKETTPNIQSRYALEYLRHKVVAQADMHLYRLLYLNVSWHWQDRMGNYQKDAAMVAYQPYALLDARLSWDATRYSLYAEANNIFNKTYYDHGNIPQPGILLRAGAAFRF